MEKSNKFSQIILSGIKSIGIILFMIIGISLARKAFGLFSASDDVGEAFNVAILYAVVLAFVIASAKFIFKHSLKDYFGDNKYLSHMLFCLVGVGLAIGVSLVTELGSYLVVYDMTSNPDFAVDVFFLTIIWITLHSVIEEFVFRGFVLTEFKQYNSRLLLGVVIFLSSVLSAFIYYLLTGCDPLAFVAYALFSISLSMLYLGTGKIWLSASVHATWVVIYTCFFFAEGLNAQPFEPYLSNFAPVTLVSPPVDGVVSIWGYSVSTATFNSFMIIAAAAMFAIIGSMYMQSSKEKAIKAEEEAKKIAMRKARKAAEKVAKREAAIKEAEKVASKQGEKNITTKEVSERVSSKQDTKNISSEEVPEVVASERDSEDTSSEEIAERVLSKQDSEDTSSDDVTENVLSEQDEEDTSSDDVTENTSEEKN